MIVKSRLIISNVIRKIADSDPGISGLGFRFDKKIIVHASYSF